MSDICLIGCGAIVEQFYLPAISSLSGCSVKVAIDPSGKQIRKVKQLYPDVAVSQSVEGAAKLASLAIVSSPSRFHSEQATGALEIGMHVLCEKPMANTVSEAEEMIATSERTGQLLAIGLFRRFFASTQAIKEIVSNESLGKPTRYQFAEGGLFNWPAASSTFFNKEHSGGGVLHDLGVHVLDLVAHWFGEPVSLEYEDDASGGLETNCLVKLNHGEFSGEVRLSRDWATSNRYYIEFERGWVAWRVGDANRIELGFHGSSQPFVAQICNLAEHWGRPSAGTPGLTYHQAFTKQLQNFIGAINGQEELLVPGTEGIRSLRIIEECYKNRREMAV